MNSDDPPSTPDGTVDGATGEDDGGRDPGDVELMLFRRIRSFSNVSGRMLLRGPGETIGRYFADPLSMFSAEVREDAGDSEGGDDCSAEDEDAPAEDEDAPAEGYSWSDEADGAGAGLQHYVSHGIAWRDAMVQACADLLGKTMKELEEDYTTALAASPPQNIAFGSEVRSFEPIPRDLADYAIMTTLKATDASAMQNATSWLFNMMDRTGAGYVLREEFVRYAPFIGPVADAAVAGIVFDELVHEQSRHAAENEAEPEAQEWKSQRERQSQRSNSLSWQKPPIRGEVRAKLRTPGEGLRRRRPLSLPARNAAARESSSRHGDEVADDDDNGSTSTSNQTALSGSSVPGDARSRDLYPTAVALRYELWRPFFIAIQDKYHCKDDDWVQVKQELGIDPCEVLIKSQGALDHSDIFPTLGKLYLSQRYLIFFAAVGRNHYVARLGAVAEVAEGAIPLMMRDSIKVQLESATKAAMDGISALQKDDLVVSGSADEKGRYSRNSDNKQEPTLSEHVGKLMRQYTAGRKPLQFSLLEFRETKLRDNWVHLIREMVAAHKLHVQLGFGSSGRAVPRVDEPAISSAEPEPQNDANSEHEERNREISETRTLNYSRSPFRNEPSPPLLAVAAHANIVRYRALRRVTKQRVSKCLLLFTNAERNASLINWYTDSVRAYNNQSGRSWIERALAAIRENMDTNDRIYRVQDDEPFDVSKLGDAIGRFAELCSPLARVFQFSSHLFQWRNPPATILAILICITIAIKGWVKYVPACLLFLQAAWVVETKYNWLGLGMGRTEFEDAERRQANVLELVAQVHDTLAAAQNVLGSLNRELGKVQALFLWGSEEWQSWVAVGILSFVGLILLVIPSRVMSLSLFFFFFFKHFLPPTNPGLKYWQAIPSRIEKRRKESKKLNIPRKRRTPIPGRSTKTSSVAT